MTVKLKEIMNRLPQDERKAVAARVKELIAEEMSLRDLRQAHRLTQERIAESLGIGQEGVSRLEKRTDLLISTLRGYVEAMGGRLRLVADFPDRPPIVLSGLAEMEGGVEGGKQQRSKHECGHGNMINTNKNYSPIAILGLKLRPPSWRIFAHRQAVIPSPTGRGKQERSDCG